MFQKCKLSKFNAREGRESVVSVNFYFYWILMLLFIFRVLFGTNTIQKHQLLSYLFILWLIFYMTKIYLDIWDVFWIIEREYACNNRRRWWCKKKNQCYFSLHRIFCTEIHMFTFFLPLLLLEQNNI